MSSDLVFKHLLNRQSCTHQSRSFSKLLFFCPLCRDDNAVIAKMNVLFDKAAYEKGRIVKTEQDNDVSANSVEDEGAKLVEETIRNSISSSKLGALTVDPTFLHFRTLDGECDYFIVLVL